MADFGFQQQIGFKQQIGAVAFFIDIQAAGHVTNGVTEDLSKTANQPKDWSGREDLNLRPPGPEPGALPG